MVLLGGGDVSIGSWLGLSPREGACPGLESELSWGVSWLDMEEPEGRMGALLNRAGEKSLRRKKKMTYCPQISFHIFLEVLLSAL